MGGSKNLGGRYKLGRTIGHGTFGKVKEATNIKTGASVAVKILSLKTIEEHGLHQIVQTEVTALKKLPKHKHVVNMYEVLRSADSFYFIIELVKGGELFDKIQSEGAFDEDKARMYFKQLVSGLEFMHRHKICHRDLKLENLLVDENGILKITDFGLSGLHKEKRSAKSSAIHRPVEELVSSLRPPEDRGSDMLSATTSASSGGSVSVSSIGGGSTSGTGPVASSSSLKASSATHHAAATAAVDSSSALPTASSLTAESIPPKTTSSATDRTITEDGDDDDDGLSDGRKKGDESESEYSSDDKEGVDGFFTTTLGSPNYVAPEVLNGRGYDGYMADIWSSGIILYALVAGFLPFDEESPTLLFQKICTGDLMYPETFSLEIIDLLNNMLQVDPSKRYTLSEIKRHVWFNKEKLKVDEHGRRVSLCSILEDSMSIASGAAIVRGDGGGGGGGSAVSTPASVVGVFMPTTSPRTGGGGMTSSSIGGADGELRIEVVDDIEDDASVTGMMSSGHHWMRAPVMAATVTSSTGPGTAITKTKVTAISGGSRTLDTTIGSAAADSVTLDDSTHTTTTTTTSGSSRKSRSASLGDGHSLRAGQSSKKHGKSDSLVIRVEGFSGFKGGSSLGSSDMPDIDSLSPSPSPFMMESTASGMVSDASGNELKPFPITAFDLIGIVSTQMLSNVFTRSLHEPHLTKTYSRFVTKANPAKILWVIHQAAYRMPECTYTMSAHNCYELTMVKFFGSSESIVANVTVYHTPADEYVVECRRKQGNIFKYRDFFAEFQKTYFDVLHRLAKVTDVDGAPAFGWTATAADASSTSAKSVRSSSKRSRKGGGGSGARPRSTKSVESSRGGHSSQGSSDVDLSVLSVASEDAVASSSTSALGVTAIAKGKSVDASKHQRASSASGAPDKSSLLRPSVAKKKSKRSSSDIAEIKKGKGKGKLSEIKEGKALSAESSSGSKEDVRTESLKLSMASRVARKKSSQSSTASSAEDDFVSVIPRTGSLGTRGLSLMGPGSSRSLASDSSPLMCSVTPTRGDEDETYFPGSHHSPHISTTDSGGGLMLSHTSQVSTDSGGSDTHVRYPSSSVTQSSSLGGTAEMPIPRASSLSTKGDEHHLKVS